MINPFEEIKKSIDQLHIKVVSLESKIKTEKRWLSTLELSEYIPYSRESINKKVQHGELIYGVHFFQNAKIRMFDKIKIDEWIMSNKLSSSQELLKENLLSKIQSDIKS